MRRKVHKFPEHLPRLLDVMQVRFEVAWDGWDEVMCDRQAFVREGWAGPQVLITDVGGST